MTLGLGQYAGRGSRCFKTARMTNETLQIEFLDIVDADDNVVGRASRADIHARMLMHRAAHVFVWNSHRELFVQQRAWWKECAPGLWDSSAAGHVASGEDYLSAAARELTEELGLIADILTPFATLPASSATGLEHVIAYQVMSDDEVRPDAREIIDFKWCTHATLTAWIAAEPKRFTSTFLRLWQLSTGHEQTQIP